MFSLQTDDPSVYVVYSNRLLIW